jgi:hypothetical protein
MSDERTEPSDTDGVQHVTAEEYKELKRELRQRDEDRRSLARLSDAHPAPPRSTADPEEP